MAAVVIAPIAEKASGAAFEVKIKGQVNESTKCAAQARLESYAGSPLPSLLKSRALAAASKPLSHDRAEKARRQNEQKREAAERLRADLDNSARAKHEGLVQALEKATEKRQEALAGRKVRAGQHWEKVMARSGECQQRQAEESKALRQRLEQEQEQKGVHLAAILNQRTTRANHHNEAVAGKVLQHQEFMERHTAECRAAAPAERLALLSERLYERFYVACPR